MANDNPPLDLVKMVTEHPGFMSSLGTEVLFTGPGEVHLRLQRKPELLQFNGFFHGGVISGLADHAAGGAVTLALPVGKIAVTIDLHVNFLAPANGRSITARAKALQVGKTVATANVEVFTTEEGKEHLCSVAIVALRVVDMPPRS